MRISSRLMAQLVATAFLIGGMSGVHADVPAAVDSFELQLNRENLATWRDHILPAPGELNFEQIPWLTTFKDGILTADKENRPLLFWTMNGHPLGCT